MSEVAIQIDNLGKRYSIGAAQRTNSLRESIMHCGGDLWRRCTGGNSRATEELWAVREISCTIKQGEVVGIIGRNGAGKSTLLKILSRITEPTTGQAVLRGRIGSLLEVGTGFHSELTGRENIYLSGAILGMKKSEITRNFDAIVAFAEVEKFLDTPVKRYSSGMHVRLGFAVAAYLEPEILLVDEVLAVGDVGFQKKCLGKISAVTKSGRTVLFVSHNMAAVGGLCDRCMFLQQGRLRTIGSTDEVIGEYLRSLHEATQTALAERTDRRGNGALRFTGIRYLDEKLHPVESFMTGRTAIIEMAYESTSGKPLENVCVSFAICNSLDVQITTLKNEETEDVFSVIPPQGIFRCCLPDLPIVSGRYSLNLYSEVNGVIADWLDSAGSFVIEKGDFFGSGRNADREQSIFLLHNEWAVHPA